MVKKYGLVFLCVALFYPAWSMADVRMMLKADKHTIAMGEPLTVTLTVEDVTTPLSEINLDKLKQNFNVYGVSSTSQTITKKGRRIATEILTLTLYPLYTGKLSIPALSYKGKRSSTLPINVQIASKLMSPVFFKTAVDIQSPLVRQSVTLFLDVYDDGTLHWDAPREIVAAGMYQRRLAETQNEEMLEGIRYTVHHYRWALMPLREGQLTVEFPLLEALKLGTKLRYPLAPLNINVAAAPAYLPVHVPVGKVDVTIESLPLEVAINKPVNWILNIQGTGISAEGVLKLLSGLQSNEAIKIYPLTVSDESVRPVSAQQTLKVVVPLVPLRTGKLQLPDINFPFYNPETARVESVIVNGQFVEVFNPVWGFIGKLLLALLIFMALFVIGYVAYKYYFALQKKRRALLLVRNAKTAVELRAALLNFPDGYARHSTLQQWLAERHCGKKIDAELDVLVQTIESACYAKIYTGESIVKLAQQAMQLLKRLPKKSSRVISA